jgi:hypothetical protein
MTLINITWVGLWSGITFTTVLLVVLEYAMDNYADRDGPEALAYRRELTMVRLVLCVCVGGGVLVLKLVAKFVLKLLAKLLCHTGRSCAGVECQPLMSMEADVLPGPLSTWGHR